MSMLMLKRKIFTAFILGFIIVIIGIIPVNAYNLLGYKWPNSTIYYYFDNFNSTRAKSFISQGAGAWNDTDATYLLGGSINIYATAVNLPEAGWDGLSSWSISGNYYTSFYIYLNEAETLTWNDDGALKSVSVHEFGHGLGLGENGTTQTIMNSYTLGDDSRYGGYGLTTPQNDDINGVNSMY